MSVHIRLQATIYSVN